jgi:hypothetical protein
MIVLSDRQCFTTESDNNIIYVSVVKHCRSDNTIVYVSGVKHCRSDNTIIYVSDVKHVLSDRQCSTPETLMIVSSD